MIALTRVDRPDHPDLPHVIALLHDAFAADGEVESPAAIASFLAPDPLEPVLGETRSAYVLVLARVDGAPAGARAACVLTNPHTAPGICAVFLANIVVAPAYRRGAVTPALRDAPLAAARDHLAALEARGVLLASAQRILTIAEMEPPLPGDGARTRRLRSYARAGFAALDLPFAQPALGAGAPTPMSFVVRRDEHPDAAVPAATVRALVDLLADDYRTATTDEAVAAAYTPTYTALADGRPVRLVPLDEPRAPPGTPADPRCS